jgi:hypothetical protein
VQKQFVVRWAAGVEQGVAEHGETGGVEVAGGEEAVVVGDLGQTLHEAVVAGEPGRVDGGRGAEGGAEDVPEQVRMCPPLDLQGGRPSSIALDADPRIDSSKR